MPFKKGQSGCPEKKFKPGESGNPGGRPKKRPITDRYERLMEEPLPDDLRLLMRLPEGATYGDGVVRGVAIAAMKGKFLAATEIREATEGKATARVEISGPGERGEHTVKLSVAETIAFVRAAFGATDPQPDSGAKPVAERSDKK